MITNDLFFKMLNETNETNIDQNEDENENRNYCYITNEELDTTKITLSCNHSFNYIPLYEEIVKQKNSIRNKLNHLSTSNIECPYCRQVQNGVLPYIKIPGVKKIKGVNSPKEWSLITKKCFHCNTPCVDNYCCKSHEVLYNKCMCLTKKGSRCNNKGKTSVMIKNKEIKLCAIHFKQYNEKGISQIKVFK